MGKCCSKLLKSSTQQRVDRWEAANNYQRTVSQKAQGDILDCLFFPEHVSPLMGGGGGKSGGGSRGGGANRRRFLEVLRSTKFWIDICIFTLTDDEIAEILLDLFHRNVHVRIIADLDQADALGADIHALSEQLPIVHDNDQFSHMHHKFCVIDGLYVINGSYNWTRAAAKRNRENLVISNDRRMVEAFMGEFAKLWQEFEGNYFPGAWRQQQLALGAAANNTAGNKKQKQGSGGGGGNANGGNNKGGGKGNKQQQPQSSGSTGSNTGGGKNNRNSSGGLGLQSSDVIPSYADVVKNNGKGNGNWKKQPWKNRNNSKNSGGSGYATT
ncbi:unnamed protein product [Amoebophrya sp. A120]|nr:unnamed protein product [Amoebophrya sp. A120]|eukprot:GSA120T00025075001.1